MKLYLYPNIRVHTQDTIPDYYDTTPFSEAGIKRHCKIVDNPADADFLYMSQVVDLPEFHVIPPHFKYVLECPKRHILDLEGDWPENSVGQWALDCVKSGNATKKEHYVQPFCVRPCFSKLLALLGKENPAYDLEFPDVVSFGFRGMHDPFGVRTKMANCIKKMDVPCEITINQQWAAQQPLESPIVSMYITTLHEHLLSLCPRGSGMDTIRFYESCFFGRVPIVISEMALMGEGDVDTSFVYRIPTTASEEIMTQELTKIYNTPRSELIERGRAAHQYFQDVIVTYFKDPTKYFIDWMKKRNLWNE